MKYCNTTFYETKNFIKHIPHYSRRQKIRHLVSWIIYPFLNLYNKIITSIIGCIYKNEPFQKDFPVVLVSIFKNEARYLKEWIEYYKLIGIDHIFLYNNNSQDNYLDILKEYIEEGFVTLTDWPIMPGQIPAYEHWYKTYKYQCGYAAFVDLDELICPLYDSNIKSWLKQFKKYPVIKMDWIMFGTCGHIEHDPNKLIIEQYDSCWNKRLSIGKIFYNCSYEILEFTPICMHLTTVYKKSFPILPVNDSCNISLWNGVEVCSKRHTIQLNHYYSRSLEGLKGKISRGDAVFRDKQFTLKNYMERENMNKTKDYTIQRFILQLKLNINKIEL